MSSELEKWEQRYRSEKKAPGVEPAPFLRELLPLLPRGRALDVATGSGRNAMFLAAHGWRVTGIDFSRAALEKAGALADQQAVEASWATPPYALVSNSARLVLVQADLEQCAPPENQFDVVICFSYLQRSLFGALERSLRPGGVLVYETFTLAQLAFPDGPRKPEYLLRPGELRSAFPSLELLFYREFCAGKAVASLVGRKR